MDSFSTDGIDGSSHISSSPVVKLQYKGAVYDNSIRILPQTNHKELYQNATSLANLLDNATISLLRLDHLGELVTDPHLLNDGELLEIMEGSPEDAIVVARMTELRSASGSSPESKAHSVKGTLEFLHIVENLKRTKRTGWINNGIKPAESIADHMYRMSMMALLIDEKTAGVDKNHCIKMAIVHDLAESLVNAMRHLCHELLGWSTQAQEISALWEEYEGASTPEALLVKDFDKFEMIMQAFEYEKTEDATLEDFFAGTRGKFKHPMVTAWVNELEAERAQSRAIKS
ncbi:HD domain-containing protein 2 [Dissophora globulifera]|uniref:5'-deoxynucleotidase n=1 Tax=Dissophora globulifera TaxID=979702 RepID=A0A9P6UMC8_9FUNG|nr:HD domain-containing protein 2 [Dissophora globulifera]